VRCAGCGSELPPGARFCPACGRAVAAATGSRSLPGPAAAPGRLAAVAAAREGERKQVTVLFADLKGSLELLADRDPEDARRLLDPVLERMIDAVRRYGGTVNQVLGDGIMALFGAPLAQEDHAVRACYAALTMQASVAAYAREVQRSEGVPIQIRVGLNSGEVVVRSIDSDLHLDYSAVGQTTHLAGRMEQMALPGSILLTGATLRLAEDYVEVRPLGPVPVRGLGNPVDVYELTGAGPVRSRLDAARARGLTRFVGRTRELAALREALAAAAAGDGRTVVVLGEAGVGKSRLLDEFARSPDARTWLVLEAAATTYGRMRSEPPVVELLRRYFGVDAGDDTQAIREKVAGRVLVLDEALRDILPPILALLDALPDDWAFRTLDPEERRREILEAIPRLLTRASRRSPLLLIVEDLHWIDAESLAVLETLAARLSGHRVLLVVSLRPEGGDVHLRFRAAVEVRLEPLPPESATGLLDTLLGEDTGLGPLKRLLVERTGGNPFFLEETVRALVETGVLSGRPGAFALTRAAAEVQIPATVQALLAARIDRLSPEDKRLLQTAAVIGVDVPSALLRAVAGFGDEDLRAGLARLEAAELLDQSALFPDPEYRFRHALTHDVAYQSLLSERRRALHRSIVEAIEAQDRRHGPARVEQLADHAVRGELWDEAVVYLRRAGARAAARAAYEEAVGRFRQALSALESLPRRRETLEEALALRLDLRRALLPLGRPTEILDHLAAAAALAEELGDRRELVRVLVLRANHAWWVGEPAAAAAAAERALALARALGDRTLETTARFYLGQARHARGDYEAAIEDFRAVVTAAEAEAATGTPPRVASLFFGVWLVRCLVETGREEALHQAERTVALAARLDSPPAAVATAHARGWLAIAGHDLGAGIAALERARALAESVRVPVLALATDTLLGRGYTLAGTTAGVPLLTAAAERAEVLGLWVDQSLRLAWLAEAKLGAGDPAGAAVLADRALALARRHGERGNEAHALAARALVAGREGRDDRAEAEAAAALADRLGMRALAARCRLGSAGRRIGPQTR
jgi:class 3 adenylate cyclase/tetratricopeptide (TPR) repeat protein